MNNDLMSAIASLLSDPGALNAIKQLADTPIASPSAPETLSAQIPANSSLPGFFGSKNDASGSENPGSVGTLTPSVGVRDKNVALLNAIAPYMRAERAAKISSAIKAIRVIGMISSLK